MTTTLTISKAQKNIDRAAKYLQLMEECKARYRDYERLSRQHVYEPHRPFYAGKAKRMKALYPYLVYRYNECLLESIILIDNI